jgi:hypothetical protein
MDYMVIATDKQNDLKMEKNSAGPRINCAITVP